MIVILGFDFRIYFGFLGIILIRFCLLSLVLSLPRFLVFLVRAFHLRWHMLCFGKFPQKRKYFSELHLFYSWLQGMQFDNLLFNFLGYDI